MGNEDLEKLVGGETAQRVERLCQLYSSLDSELGKFVSEAQRCFFVERRHHRKFYDVEYHHLSKLLKDTEANYYALVRCEEGLRRDIIRAISKISCDSNSLYTFNLFLNLVLSLCNFESQQDRVKSLQDLYEDVEMGQSILNYSIFLNLTEGTGYNRYYDGFLVNRSEYLKEELSKRISEAHNYTISEAHEFLLRRPFEIFAIGDLRDESYLRTFLELVGKNECQSLEEVDECTLLGLTLENTGYSVLRRIATGPSGVFKRVYLVEHRQLGTQHALKEVNHSPEVLKILRGKGITVEEMVKKDLAPFISEIRHPNICATFPLAVGDEVFILEDLYDHTLEEEIRRLHKGEIILNLTDLYDLHEHTLEDRIVQHHEDRIIRGHKPFVAVMPDRLSALIQASEKGEGFCRRVSANNIPSCQSSSAITKDCFIREAHTERVLSLIYQLLSAVECCHEHDHVHADIKTDNIGIKKDGTLVLSDFGVSTLAREISGASLEGRIGGIYTTDPRLFSKGGPDKQSDLWSVGAVIYRVCTGRYPFSKEPVVLRIPSYSAEVKSEMEKERRAYGDFVKRLSETGEVNSRLEENLKKYWPAAFEVVRWRHAYRRERMEVVGRFIQKERVLDLGIMELIKDMLHSFFRMKSKSSDFSYHKGKIKEALDMVVDERSFPSNI
ncbi:MAG: protein kinase [Nanoarchaeota archaeon]